MLVRCPNCRSVIRMADFDRRVRVVRYLCAGCEDIVPIDLLLDEVRSSASADSFQQARQCRTILVATDSPVTREVATSILRQDGFRVVAAGSGFGAMEVIRAHHPDLVLLDLNMPGMSSFDILRQIRRESRLQQTAVIVVGGVYKPRAIGVLHGLGASGFLDRDQLVETLSFRVRAILDEVDSRRRSAADEPAKRPFKTT